MSKKSAKDNVSENFKRFLLVSLEVVIDDPIENANHGQSIATYFDPALSFHDYRDYQKLNVDFTEIFKLLKIYLSIPVTSVGAERSFSCLKRLKTWLRNNMGQVRLSDLALLNIESETLDSIEPDKIIDDFCNNKSRRGLI
jgi:hypothetical protein